MVTGCLSDAVALCWRETPQSDGDHAVEVPDPMIILAGDIGGTHSRIEYFTSEGGQLGCVAEESYPSADYTSLDAIVTKFVASHGAKGKHACFGVAGPVRNGQVKATNLPWTVDASRLAHGLALKNVTLINDLEAIAYRAFQPPRLTAKSLEEVACSAVWWLGVTGRILTTDLRVGGSNPSRRASFSSLESE